MVILRRLFPDVPISGHREWFLSKRPPLGIHLLNGETAVWMECCFCGSRILKPLENHRKTTGKWWLNGISNGIYPLVICYIAIEHDLLLWIFPLNMVIFHSGVTVITKGYFTFGERGPHEEPRPSIKK